MVVGGGVHVTVVLVDGGREVVVGRLVGASPPASTPSGRWPRLVLAARRTGRGIELRHPCRELVDLLTLVGLGDLVAAGRGDLPLEAGGEAEGREQLGVEEAVEPGDQPV